MFSGTCSPRMQPQCAFIRGTIAAGGLHQNCRGELSGNRHRRGCLRENTGGSCYGLERATDFATRFHALKTEYDARYKCANRIEESFRDVTLPDMAQAPSLLKSIIDSIEGDIRGV